MKGNPAVLGGPFTSKPTWWNTSGCSATSAFFALLVVKEGVTTRRFEALCMEVSHPQVSHESRQTPATLHGFLTRSLTEDFKMLVLSRRFGESIVIDGGITVTVLKMKGNVVQLGFDAPKAVSIQRSEICQRIREFKALPI